jgi:hypothetical protein
MTDDRSLERAARSFIEVGPTRAPEAAVEAALLRIQSTSQERDWFPWRIPRMTTPLRLALLVGAAVLAIAGLGLLASGSPGPGPAPSSSPTPAPSPSLDAAVQAPLPTRLRGDWQALATAAITNVTPAGEPIQLSLDWDGGERAWIQTSTGDQVLMSDSLEAAEGEIRLVSTGLAGGCALGDEGRYTWDRPGDGEFLTLAVTDDPCAGRAESLARTWVHSLSAVTDGGPGVLPWHGERWFRATLPSMRFGLSGATRAAELTTFDGGDPAISFIVLQDPSGFDDPCAAGGGNPSVIDRTTDAFVTYVEGLPGVTVTTEDGQVDGRPAVHLTIESAAAACPSGRITAFGPMQPTEDGDWGFAPGATQSMWIVGDGPDTFLFWYDGDGVTAADEQAVIDSIRFLDELPTP